MYAFDLIVIVFIAASVVVFIAVLPLIVRVAKKREATTLSGRAHTIVRRLGRAVKKKVV